MPTVHPYATTAFIIILQEFFKELLLLEGMRWLIATAQGVVEAAQS